MIRLLCRCSTRLPFSPSLFSLVLRELTSKFESDGLVSLWYLDDGHLAGPSEQVLEALNVILREGTSFGLHLNLNKCLVYGNGLDLFPDEIPRSYDGLVALGTPIGTNDFIKSKVKTIVSNSISLMNKSQEIDDPQMELLLLRSCTGSPKIAFWTRTCNPEVISSELDIFDRGVDSCLQHIAGTSVTGSVRDLAHLPLSFGGLGIPIVSLIADFSFVSSIGSSWNLQPNLTPRIGYFEATSRISATGFNAPELPIKTQSVCPQITQQKDFRQRIMTDFQHQFSKTFI